MTDAPRAARASRLSEERRRQILLAAVDVVAARGYEAASVDDIAAASGTSKATLYRHWVDKPTLVVTAFLQTSSIDATRIDTGAIGSDLDALIDMMIERAASNTALVLTLAEASRHDERLRDVFSRSVLPELDSVREICERAIARGELPDPDRARFVAELLVGMLFTAPLMKGAPAASARSMRDYVRRVVLPFLTGS